MSEILLEMSGTDYRVGGALLTIFLRFSVVSSTEDMYLNLHLMERPDRIDPAIDFVGVRKGVSGGLL